jgi:NRDE-2, necessary for RNA interference
LIFTRFCNLLKQAGYTERAVALYQALIEFTWFAPREARYDVDSALVFLEQFWNADCARVGEDGACGWNQWRPAHTPSVVSGRSLHTGVAIRSAGGGGGDSGSEDGSPSFARWVSAELDVAQRGWAPLHTSQLGDAVTDDADALHAEVDPERVVLFEDVSPFLFALSTDRLRHRLLCACVQFMGVAHVLSVLPSSSNAVQAAVRGAATHPLAPVLDVACLRHTTGSAHHTPSSIAAVPGAAVLPPLVELSGGRRFLANLFSLLRRVDAAGARHLPLALRLCAAQLLDGDAWKQLLQEPGAHSPSLWAAFAASHPAQRAQVLGSALTPQWQRAGRFLLGVRLLLQRLSPLFPRTAAVHLHWPRPVWAVVCPVAEDALAVPGEAVHTAGSLFPAALQLLVALTGEVPRTQPSSPPTPPEVLRTRQLLRAAALETLHELDPARNTTDSQQRAVLADQYLNTILLYAFFQYITQGVTELCRAFEWVGRDGCVLCCVSCLGVHGCVCLFVLFLFLFLQIVYVCRCVLFV